MTRKILINSIWILLLFSSMPDLFSNQNINLKLFAEPDAFHVKCPATIKFKGRIIFTQEGKIRYKFIRSDGGSSKVKSLNFQKPGWKDVSTTWTLSRDYRGWVAIKVLSPQSVESNRALFKVNCKKREHPLSKAIPETKKQLTRGPMDLKVKPKATIPIDLISRAQQAQWFNDLGHRLPFPGKDSDSRGFVKIIKTQLEWLKKSQDRVLQTHPRWEKNGWIEGRYQLRIPENSFFEATVGFIKGAFGSDGVIYEVLWKEGKREILLKKKKHKYTGRSLTRFTIDLKNYGGHLGEFVLRVKAGSSSGQDWAVWKKAIIGTKKPRPTPSGPAIPKSSYQDPNEPDILDGKDFKVVKFGCPRNKDIIMVTIEFFRSILLREFFLYCNNDDDYAAEILVRCKRDKFEVARESQPGYYDTIIFRGTPTVSGAIYSMEIPCTAIFDNLDKVTTWIYAMDGKDRLPDKGNFLEFTHSACALHCYSDTDYDGIPDKTENKLLQKFSPYFKFTKGETYRPSDVIWQIKLGGLKKGDWLDGFPPPDASGCGGINVNPEEILTCVGGGTTNLTINPSKTNYYLNINDDKGRPGLNWDEVVRKSNIGTYGHVVPAKGGFCKDDYPKQVLGDIINKLYKIEYWQYFGYSGTDYYAADHEGDWTTVQLWVEPKTEKIVLTCHFSHGKGLCFDMRKTRDIVRIDAHISEYRGPNYGKDIGFSIAKGSPRYRSDSQNNHVRFYNKNHIVVYFERDAHECFPSEKGDIQSAPEHSGNGVSFLTRNIPNLGEVDYPNPLYKNSKIILWFNGRWGAFHHHSNHPPPGPTLHCQWTWPINAKKDVKIGACRDCEF